MGDVGEKKVDHSSVMKLGRRMRDEGGRRGSMWILEIWAGEGLVSFWLRRKKGGGGGNEKGREGEGTLG